MELTHLRAFRAIVEHGSLTAAARALGCKQPTLTAAVQRLEAHFQTTLLQRTSRGVVPTSTGLELARCAAVVTSTLEATMERIAGLENDEVGRFVVGCHDSLGAYFLPEFLSGFLPETPTVEVALWNGPSSQVLDRVVEREVHFGLVVNPRPHPDLVPIRLFRDAVDVFTVEPAASLGAARERLRSGTLLVAGRLPQSQAWLEWLEAESLGPARVLTCGELELVKSLTRAGLGLGVLPRRVATHGEPSLRRLHPDLPCCPDEIVLLYRADLHRTRAALRLKDALVAHGRRLDAAFEGGESLPGGDPVAKGGPRRPREEVGANALLRVD